MDDTNAAAWSPAGPCAMVMFGAKGDLTRRKLLPALYYLRQNHLLPNEFAMVGFARGIEDRAFREALFAAARKHVSGELDEGIWNWLKGRFYTVAGTFRNGEAFVHLTQTLAQAARRGATIGGPRPVWRSKWSKITARGGRGPRPGYSSFVR